MYREAYKKLGILEDNKQWHAIMEESMLCRSPEKHLQTVLPALVMGFVRIYFSQVSRSSSVHFNSRKKIILFWNAYTERVGELSSDVIRELDYDTAVSQREIRSQILRRIENGEGDPSFLTHQEAWAKHFNFLLAQLRKYRNITFAVPPLALLQRCSSYHLILQPKSPFNIGKKCSRSVLLQQCKCTMSHKQGLNRSLQDIRSNRALMGGVVVLHADDFSTYPTRYSKRDSGG
ncbi:hypothetical protein PR048_020349 [Dryococelus australis]|uniref:Uncharacterized protein n=1 Tax=Dryococelus australis TaxID=614101 RepID=A0ABQ9H697_9NEOP|nr:hypothetical protein PR048_020349 [Dryococelus australis]